MGLMDAVFLQQKLAELARENLCRFDGAPRDDLLEKAHTLEAEARRLGVPDFIASALMRRADILIALRRDHEAIDALDEARQVLDTLRQQDLGVYILGTLAEIHARYQDWQTVSSICEEGIKLVETYRYKVTSQYLQSAYMRFRINLYALGVRAAYELRDYRLMLERAEFSKCRFVVNYQKRTPTSTANQEQNEREFRRVCEQIDSVQRAQETAPEQIEQLLRKRRMLWDMLYIQRYQVRAGESLPEFSLNAVQSILDENEAIIYYYWLDQHTLLIVTIDHWQFIPEMCPISPEQRVDLEKLVNYNILERNPNKGHINRLDEVQDFSLLLLPGKAKQILSEKQRLLFSPHRLLHSIPFHALRWDADVQYLIQRFAVTYIPNLSSLLFRYSPSRQQNIMALGICDFQVPGYEGLLGSISQAENEVKALENLYKERSIPITLLIGPEAREDELQKLEKEGKLGKFTCLHFATHGDNIKSDTPMESHLYLRDSLLEGLEIANWKLDAEVVVLSACCSGQRAISGRGMEELPGDELFGLQAAFFAAGARWILSSLWPVDSYAALPITKNFHCYMADGKQPELALQAAVKDYLKTASVLRRKIYYWAPLFISAMGRPTL